MKRCKARLTAMRGHERVYWSEETQSWVADKQMSTEYPTIRAAVAAAKILHPEGKWPFAIDAPGPLY